MVLPSYYVNPTSCSREMPDKIKKLAFIENNKIEAVLN